MRSLLFLCLICWNASVFQLATALESPCWNQPFTPDCTKYGVSNSDPGVDGNLAFTTFYDTAIFSVADDIAQKAATIFGNQWQGAIPHQDYHISIYYMFCVAEKETAAIHAALSTFNWDTLTVTIDHVQCEPGYVELALDPSSQYVMANFSLAIRNHLNANGVPVPDLTVLQPPFHITIGHYNASSTLPMPPFGHAPVTQSLDVFYLGATPYFSNNFATSGGVSIDIYIIVGVVGIIIIVCLIAGKYRAKGDCPSCCSMC